MDAVVVASVTVIVLSVLFLVCLVRLYTVLQRETASLTAVCKTKDADINRLTKKLQVTTEQQKDAAISMKKTVTELKHTKTVATNLAEEHEFLTDQNDKLKDSLGVYKRQTQELQMQLRQVNQQMKRMQQAEEEALERLKLIEEKQAKIAKQKAARRERKQQQKQSQNSTTDEDTGSSLTTTSSSSDSGDNNGAPSGSCSGSGTSGSGTITVTSTKNKQSNSSENNTSSSNDGKQNNASLTKWRAFEAQSCTSELEEECSNGVSQECTSVATSEFPSHLSNYGGAKLCTTPTSTSGSCTGKSKNQNQTQMFARKDIGLKFQFPICTGCTDYSTQGNHPREWELVQSRARGGVFLFQYRPKCAKHHSVCAITITVESLGVTPLAQYHDIALSKLTQAMQGQYTVDIQYSNQTRVASTKAIEMVYTQTALGSTKTYPYMNTWNLMVKSFGNVITVQHSSSIPADAMYQRMLTIMDSMKLTFPTNSHSMSRAVAISPAVLRKVKALQNWWRGVLTVKEYRQKLATVCRLQRAIRCWLAFKKVSTVRLMLEREEHKEDTMASIAFGDVLA
eukprot:TRINITY_DN67565_c10_g5_i4.p1 TRINITY_DN67565_c10_g5~~TRINITY_DN67565_c10_g5_i4.p1  ORF type:complete len:573 (+),score=102.65 TRINITY_DN67565_c10_g5_i4:24-1721(+)